MANPNLFTASSIYGNTGVLIANSTPANVISNVANSSSIVKVNTVTLANYSTATISANVEIFRGGVSYYIAGNLAVPNNASIMVSAKDSAFYLVEGDGLRITSSANLAITAAYEVIS